MKIIDFISRPNLWHDSQLLSPITEVFGVEKNGDSRIIEQWNFDIKNPVNSEVIQQSYKLINDAFNTCSEYFPSVNERLNKVFLCKGHSDD